MLESGAAVRSLILWRAEWEADVLYVNAQSGRLYTCACRPASTSTSSTISTSPIMADYTWRSDSGIRVLAQMKINEIKFYSSGFPFYLDYFATYGVCQLLSLLLFGLICGWTRDGQSFQREHTADHCRTDIWCDQAKDSCWRSYEAWDKKWEDLYGDDRENFWANSWSLREGVLVGFNIVYIFIARNG